MSSNTKPFKADDINSEQLLFKINTSFKQIHELVLGLQPLVKGLQESGHHAPEFQQYLENIQLAHQRLSRQAHDEHRNLIKLIKDKKLSEETLKRVRHDLRAQVSTILGYGDLILEDLLSQENKEDISQLAMMTDILKKIIPLIDSLNLVNNLSTELNTGSDTNPLYQPPGGLEDRFPDSTVLIIDDSASNQEILIRHLKNYGVKVQVAENGAMGLAIATEQSVDLILLDIMMPVMDGYEVLSHLKKDEKTKEIPVLMISALSEIESIVRGLEMGAEDYLTIPFNPVILHARIKTCLEKKALYDREHETLKKLEQARQSLETAIESIKDGFAVYGVDNHLMMSNERFKELYPGVQSLGGSGFTQAEFLRENYNMGVFFEERRATNHLEPKDQEDWIKLYEARHNSLNPYLVQLKDGRWIEVTNSRTPDGGLVCLHKDVTDHKKDQERLTYLALHDPLTGLANRSEFEAQLSFCLKGSSDRKDIFAVMYLDLDNFKNVNDTLGHEAGDKLLVQVSKTIQSCTRAQDITARLGGDEFAILFRESVTPDILRAIGDRMLEEVGTQFEYEGKTVEIGISIGIAIYPDDGEVQDIFLAHADAAMYAAKRAGKGQFKLFQELVKSPYN